MSLRLLETAGDFMERAVFVYVTFPSLAEAEEAGRAIVARRLAACVNILPGMVSHYWWEGKVGSVSV
jgi:periplasmic divalent cation tolerance protein